MCHVNYGCAHQKLVAMTTVASSSSSFKEDEKEASSTGSLEVEDYNRHGN